MKSMEIELLAIFVAKFCIRQGRFNFSHFRPRTDTI